MHFTSQIPPEEELAIPLSVAVLFNCSLRLSEFRFFLYVSIKQANVFACVREIKVRRAISRVHERKRYG